MTSHCCRTYVQVAVCVEEVSQEEIRENVGNERSRQRQTAVSQTISHVVYVT